MRRVTPIGSSFQGKVKPPGLKNKCSLERSNVRYIYSVVHFTMASKLVVKNIGLGDLKLEALGFAATQSHLRELVFLVTSIVIWKTLCVSPG